MTILALSCELPLMVSYCCTLLDNTPLEKNDLTRSCRMLYQVNSFPLFRRSLATIGEDDVIYLQSSTGPGVVAKNSVLCRLPTIMFLTINGDRLCCQYILTHSFYWKNTYLICISLLKFMSFFLSSW